MNSRDLLLKTLSHKEPDRIVFDMGSTAVTGIHVLALENLSADYCLEKIVTENARATGKGFVVGLGGTAPGDIALVPGMQLRLPKGIRGISERYISNICALIKSGMLISAIKKFSRTE